MDVFAMIHRRIENLNIAEESEILSPDALKSQFRLAENDIVKIMNWQRTVKFILDGTDPRLMIVVGPCSIHDPKAAIEYAQKLKSLSEQVQDKIQLIMRVYFEKPRTAVGWQGLINDPHLDHSFHIEEGLKIARRLLLEITRMDLPVAGEALDIVTPPYIQDLISYTAIGARTVESQSHRKMASGLTSAVGFKNATWGDLDIAVHAIASARNPHNFVSINPEGHASVIRTKGNDYGHIILRGGKQPNYSRKDIQECIEKLRKNNLLPSIVVDCSHGNSLKKPERQGIVFRDLLDQILEGNASIRGLMLESNLFEGNQPLTSQVEDLKYGVSITDACIGWEETESLILETHEKL